MIGEIKENEGTKRGRSAFDDPDGEDPFERLEEAQADDPWDKWIINCDGVGGGLDKGFAEGQATIGQRQDVTAQEDTAGDRMGEADIDGEGWVEKGGAGIEELGRKELETIIRKQGRTGAGARPKGFAWDDEDYARASAELEAVCNSEAHAEREERGQSVSDGPQVMDGRVVLRFLQEQSEQEARSRYARWGNKYKNYVRARSAGTSGGGRTTAKVERRR